MILGGPQGPAVEFGERLALSNSQSHDQIYKVSDGRKAKLGTVILTNDNESQTATVEIYDCASTVSNRILKLIVKPYGTIPLGPEQLIGVKEALSSFEVRSTVSGLFVSLGGYESPG